MTRPLPARAGALTLLMLALAVVLAGAAACGSPAPDDPVTLRVLGASSLTKAFTRIGADFEKAHPGVKVAFAFAGSQELVAQVGQGVPADVIATADTASMDSLGDAAPDPRVFATNELAIAVAPGNPEGITGLASLADPGLTVVMAAPEVPAGRYAREALARARVKVKPASLEPSAADVLAIVSLGEADAGVVYASDAAGAAGKVEVVRVVPAENVTATYPIAVLAGTGSRFIADRFVDYVLSDTGQRTLRSYGFGPPQ
jgi:molybdate transport system substrate-binding protein